VSDTDCARCVANGAEKVGAIRAVRGLPGVTQCPECSYRVAYGEVAPRVTVYPDGEWRCLTFEIEGEVQVGVRVDAGLARLIADALLSIS
jgi:hypothetical protein